MLTVVGSQAREVPPQTVGSGRDVLVAEVVERVWQSVQEHAAGAFDIAEDPPGFFAGCYLGAVPCFPSGDEVEKCFPIRCSGNPGDPE